MIFAVSGADHATAADRLIIVEAQSEDHAASVARSRGVLTSSIVQVPESPSGRRLPVLVRVLYFVLTFAALLGTLAFVAAFSSVESAPQECAVGAFFATLFVAGYIFCRAVEKTTAR